MKGLILINAYNKDGHYLNQAYRLNKEFKTLGVGTDIVANNAFLAYIDDDGQVVSHAEEYGFCIYLDKDKYLSRLLEKSGLRLYNTHDATRKCDDKYRTYIELSGQGIAMPRTLPAPLCYTRGAAVEELTYKKIERELGYPLVVKTSYGSLGAGVSLAKNRAELVELSERLISVPHMYQRFVGGGADVRVIVIGGKAFAAMKRTNKTDFRSNIELGGVGEPYNLAGEVKTVAERSAVLLDLDYCGVDILFDGQGKPVLCEVNSNAYFGGIEAVTGANVAKRFAEYILDDSKL